VVLTVLATEIAARTGKGETRGTRMKMIKWFLLNGVDGDGARACVYLADELSMMVAAAAADACFPIGNTAVMRTKEALHLFVL
jgi:hypothetical protein